MDKIKSFSLDLETFSDVDLKKSDVYRYAESPNFEILLFAYSEDNGHVQVVDLARDEKVPEHILAALADETITKWAYNASFERVCLSYWLKKNYPCYFKSYGSAEDTVGNYLDSSSWKCSRIWGAYMGLPLSLEGIGSVLKLNNQKLRRVKTSFVISVFPANLPRVLSFLAGELWRMDVFAQGKDIYFASASQMFHVPVEKHGINSHLRQKGKIAELSLGYGGSIGALKAMGALEMGLREEKLQPLVDAWRSSNTNITAFWLAIDAAVKQAVIYKTAADTHGFHIYYRGGMLFIDLPSGRRLSYVKPRMGVNKFGSNSVTYEGTTNGKWVRIESYGPKFIENIVQAVSSDILAYAMQTVSDCFICGHVHDELIIECSPDVSLEFICEQMAKTPPWIKGLLLRADGYECNFYQKQ